MKPPLTREEFNALASMATEPGGLTAVQIERVLDSHRALLDRDDPHEPAFYKVGQTGVEDAVPVEADRIKALEAEVQRFVGERDAALSRLGTLKNNLSIAMKRTTELEVLAGKVNAIRNSIVGMQGFNFSEHAYPLVAALDEAGIHGVGYEMAAKNLGTLIEQRDVAEKERDTERARADANAAEAAMLREALKDFALHMRHGEACDVACVCGLERFVTTLRAALAPGASAAWLEERDAEQRNEGFADGRAEAWAQAAEKVAGARECGPGSILFGPLKARDARVTAEARAAALEEAARECDGYLSDWGRQHLPDDKRALDEAAARIRSLATTPSAPAKKHKSAVTMLHEDGSVTCDASDCWCRG